MKTEKVRCPDCGAEMVLRQTNKYKYGDGANRKFFGCSRYPNCKAAHGAHPDGRPLGIPADKETKEARIRAHEAFDNLREKHGVKKTPGYYWLGALLNIPLSRISEDCHIAKFNKDECKMVINICEIEP